MSIKYIRKSALVTGNQFLIADNPSLWPAGVVADGSSPTGYFLVETRPDSIKEEVFDPEPITKEYKRPISDKDFVFTDDKGKVIIKSEIDFNIDFEELT